MPVSQEQPARMPGTEPQRLRQALSESSWRLPLPHHHSLTIASIRLNTGLLGYILRINYPYLLCSTSHSSATTCPSSKKSCASAVWPPPSSSRTSTPSTPSAAPPSPKPEL